MSGGAVEVVRADGKRKKRVKRIGIRIDMTPLVDVAFLLLTFFMLTASLSRPQTMELNIPAVDVPVPVPESNLMTVYVNAQGELFWNIGQIESPAKIEFAKFGGLLREKFATNSMLTAYIKIDPKAKYDMLVSLLDELALANMERYSIARMDEKDQSLIASLTEL